MTQQNTQQLVAEEACAICAWVGNAPEAVAVLGSTMDEFMEHTDGASIAQLNFELAYKYAKEEKSPRLMVGSKRMPVAARKYAEHRENKLWASKMTIGVNTLVELEIFYRVVVNTMFNMEVPAFDGTFKGHRFYYAVIGEVAEGFSFVDLKTVTDYLSIKNQNGDFYADAFAGFILDKTDLAEIVGYNTYIIETADGYMYYACRAHDCVYEKGLWARMDDVYGFHVADYCLEDEVTNDGTLDHFMCNLGVKGKKINPTVLADDGVSLGYEETIDQSFPDSTAPTVLLEGLYRESEEPGRVAAFKGFKAFMHELQLVLPMIKGKVDGDRGLRTFLGQLLNEKKSTNRGYMYDYNAHWKKEFMTLEQRFEPHYLAVKREREGVDDLRCELYETLRYMRKSYNGNGLLKQIYYLLSGAVLAFRQFDVRTVKVSTDYIAVNIAMLRDLRLVFRKKHSEAAFREMLGDVLGFLLTMSEISGLDMTLMNIHGLDLVKLVDRQYSGDFMDLQSFFRMYIHGIPFGKFSIDKFDHKGFSDNGVGYCYLNMFKKNKWPVVLMLNRYSPVLGQRASVRMAAFIDRKWFTNIVELSKKGTHVHIVKCNLLDGNQGLRTLVTSGALYKKTYEGSSVKGK